MHQTTRLASRHLPLALLLLFGFETLSGCGDASVFNRGELNELTDGRAGSELDSTDLSVELRSTRCDEHGASACPEGELPAIESFVDSTSIVIDFSNIDRPGAFANTDFEGIVIEMAPDANKPILFAKLSAETNLDIEPEAISYGRDYVEVNLSGVAFDSESFLRIDLLVGPLKLFGRGE